MPDNEKIACEFCNSETYAYFEKIINHYKGLLDQQNNQYQDLLQQKDEQWIALIEESRKSSETTIELLSSALTKSNRPSSGAETPSLCVVS